MAASRFDIPRDDRGLAKKKKKKPLCLRRRCFPTSATRMLCLYNNAGCLLRRRAGMYRLFRLFLKFYVTFRRVHFGAITRLLRDMPGRL